VGAAVGEEVSPDVVKEYRGKTSDELVFLRGRGLSDQRVALIDVILSERETGEQVPEKELVSALEEPRYRRDIEIARAERQAIQEGLSTSKEIRKRREELTRLTPTRKPEIRREYEISPVTYVRKEIPPSDVQPVPKPSGIIGKFEEGLMKIERKSTEIEQRVRRGDKVSIGERIGAGIGEAFVPLISLPVFFKQVKTEPIQTIKSIPSAIKTETIELFRQIRGPTPETAGGRIAGEVLFYKGVGRIVRGMVKTPTTKISGVEQFVRSGSVQTLLRFQRGSTIGEAIGITKVGVGEIGVSVAAGWTSKVGVRFPTARVITRAKKDFIGAEISVVKPIQLTTKTQYAMGLITKKVTTGFQQIGIGGIVGPTTQKFISRTVGIRGKGGAAFVGKTITEGKIGGKFIGIIKKAKTPDVQMIKTTGIKPTGIKPTGIISPIALKSVSAIVSKAGQQITTPKVKGVPSIKTEKGITTTVLPKQKTIQVGGIKSKELSREKTIQSSKSVSVSRAGIIGRQTFRQKSQELIKPSLRITPLITPRVKTVAIPRVITTTKTTTTIPRIIIPPREIISFQFRIRKTPPRIKTKVDGFGVAVRRGGKFRTIAGGLSLPRAIGVGRERVGKTLAATFKIIPTTGSISTAFRTPKGFRRGRGLTFIERRGLRLSTIGETREITTARKRKRRLSLDKINIGGKI